MTASEEPLVLQAQQAKKRSLAIGLAVAIVAVTAVLVSLAFAGVFSPQVSETDLLRVLHDLDKRMEGRVIFPAQEDFSSACVVWNQVSTLQAPPLAVIEVASEADVQLAIRFVSTQNVTFAIRSGGHSKAGYSNAPSGIIISLSRLNGIAVNKLNSVSAVAQLGPAIKGPEVLKATLPLGFAGVLGLCPTVAEGGFVLGGGYGLLSRKHGLGLDNLISANVVLASSNVVVANSTHNSDLLWALRGAGIGNFGVVTEMTYQLHRSHDEILMGMLALPVDQAHVFMERVAFMGAPRELTMILETEGTDSGHFPSVFNHSLLGKAVFTIMWACAETECLDDGRAFIHDELAMIVPGVEVFFHNATTWLDNPAYKFPTSYSDLVQSFTGFLHPENVTSRNLRGIIDTFHTWTKQMAPYVTVDMELWGGKISEVPAEATAFPHRNAIFNVGLLVSVPKDRPDVFSNLTRRIKQDWHKVGKFLTGSYVNYQMASLSPSEYPAAYWGTNVHRLQEIKRKYDPDHLFKYPQGISSAPHVQTIP